MHFWLLKFQLRFSDRFFLFKFKTIISSGCCLVPRGFFSNSLQLYKLLVRPWFLLAYFHLVELDWHFQIFNRACCFNPVFKYDWYDLQDGAMETCHSMLTGAYARKFSRRSIHGQLESKTVWNGSCWTHDKVHRHKKFFLSFFFSFLIFRLMPALLLFSLLLLFTFFFFFNLDGLMEFVNSNVGCHGMFLEDISQF